MKIQMSLTNNQNFKLFNRFMPRRDEIEEAVNGQVLDLREYPEDYFDAFDPEIPFTKWALREVRDFGTVPEGMEEFELQGGSYAVFQHKGSSKDSDAFAHIFRNWLPQSGFSLDQRPHFEVLGAKFQWDSSNSQQQIWIPIVNRSAN